MATMFSPDTVKKWFKPSLLKGIEVGFKSGWSPDPMNIGMMAIAGAYNFAKAPKGKGIAKGMGAGLGFGLPGLVGGIAGGLVGGNVGAWIGSLAAQMIFEKSANNAIGNTVQRFVDFNQDARGMHFGGRYTDTNVAITMRQVAAREMSRSLVNARQWLGQEAAFMA